MPSWYVKITQYIYWVRGKGKYVGRPTEVQNTLVKISVVLGVELQGNN